MGYKVVVLYLESIFAKIRQKYVRTAMQRYDTEAYDTKTRRNRKGSRKRRRNDKFTIKFFSEECPRVGESSREESLTVPVYAKRSLKTAPVAAKLLL